MAEGLPKQELDGLRKCTSTGRPCGTETFIERLKTLTGRDFSPKKRGPKPKPIKQGG